MLTSTPLPTLSRHDSVFALVLALTLLLATATFFAPFAVAAVLAGLLLSVALHRTAGRANSSDAGEYTPTINIAAIHIGGDTGGLIFVLGSVAILGLGLPALRWFLLASLAFAGVLASARILWRSRA